MIGPKKNTIRKKISNRDYANLLYYFETGEFEADLSEYSSQTLGHTEVRVMRLTQEEKSKMDEFFKNKPVGSSFATFLDTLPKETGGFQGVSVTPQPNTSTRVEQTQPEPEMMIGAEAEPHKPSVFPHWVKDPSKKLEPSNIDLAEIARIVEEGEMTGEEMKAITMDLSGKEWPERILAMEPALFEEEMDYRYKYAVSVLDVIDFAFQKRSRYLAIMNETPPTEEENADRYLTYIIGVCHTMTKPDAEKMLVDIDAVTTIEGNKIVFDNDDEKTFEYEKAEDMEHDFMTLIYRRKIDKDVQVDIFNKKTSASKIAQKFYKKFPHGVSEDKKFYHSRKEAFEDGALEI